MWDNLTQEAKRVVLEAEDIARRSSKQLHTAHYLLAFFVTKGHARDILGEARVDEVRALDALQKTKPRDDTAEVLKKVQTAALSLAENSGSTHVTSAVLLAALLRVQDSLASRTLATAGVNVSDLRNKAIGQVMRSRTALGAARVAQAQGQALDRAPLPDVTPAPMPGPQRTANANGPVTPAALTHPPSAPSLPSQAPALPSMLPPLPVSRPQPAPPPANASASPTFTSAPQTSTPGAEPGGEPGAVIDAKWTLDPKEYPTLCLVGFNLSQAAARGRLDPLIGRKDVLRELVYVLMMRRANNPCLIGEAGVGKTAIVEGLAAELVHNPKPYGHLANCIVMQIPVSELVAGTSLRGSFSERMKGLREEVAKAEGRVLIFIDEIHTLMGAGQADGPLDAANDLKTALSRGQFPLIGATTRHEYQKYIEADPAMKRRFQDVEVREPSVDETIAILQGVAHTYAQHHGVIYAMEGIEAAARLTTRYVADRCQPDKGLSVLDRAGAQACLDGKERVTAAEIADVVAAMTGVPREKLHAEESAHILELEPRLKARIVGHAALLTRIARRIQRNYAGFSSNRPQASFLFAGTPGVGKTETARALSEALFGMQDALVRFDMTEYSEPHSTSKLLGAPPGFVGHDRRGLLTLALHRRPYRVLLFDEIDRAAREVQGLLLQILDSGRITDAQGHTLDLRNAIVVMTTNLGGDVLLSGLKKKAVGFGLTPANDGGTASESKGANHGEDALATQVLEVTRRALMPELWSRIDETLVFKPLDAEAAAEIVRRELVASANRLHTETRIRYEADETIVTHLIERGGVRPEHGVRPLRALLEQVVENTLSDLILEGRVRPGDRIRLRIAEGNIVCERLSSDLEQEPSEGETDSPAEIVTPGEPVPA